MIGLLEELSSTPGYTAKMLTIFVLMALLLMMVRKDRKATTMMKQSVNQGIDLNRLAFLAICKSPDSQDHVGKWFAFINGMMVGCEVDWVILTNRIKRDYPGKARLIRQLHADDIRIEPSAEIYIRPQKKRRYHGQ